VLAVNAIANGICLGGLWAILGLGKQLLIGYLNFVNFAYGQLALITMYSSVFIVSETGLNVYVVVLVNIVGMIAVGLLLDVTLLGRLLRRTQLSQMISTLALFVIIQAVALIAFGPSSRAINAPWSAVNVSIFGASINANLLMIFGLAVIVYVIVWLSVRRTSVGLRIRAAVSNRGAAICNGVNIRRVYRFGFVLSTTLAGIVGSLYITQTSVSPTAAGPLLLLMFVVPVLGGFGSIWATFLAGALVGVVQDLTVLYLPSAYENAFVYALFVGFLIVRPNGIAGSREIRES
jgi:branched-chain amino acid transport system permease protein